MEYIRPEVRGVNKRSSGKKYEGNFLEFEKDRMENSPNS
jgi:hypothetical protein